MRDLYNRRKRLEDWIKRVIEDVNEPEIEQLGYRKNWIHNCSSGKREGSGTSSYIYPSFQYRSIELKIFTDSLLCLYSLGTFIIFPNSKTIILHNQN